MARLLFLSAVFLASFKTAFLLRNFNYLYLNPPAQSPPPEKLLSLEKIIEDHPHYADGWQKLAEFWQTINPRLAEFCRQQAHKIAPWRF